MGNRIKQEQLIDEIKTTVEYYASRTHSKCRQLNRDDVIQTFYETALTLKNECDSTKGTAVSFFSSVFKNKSLNLLRAQAKENKNIFFTDFSEVEPSVSYDFTDVKQLLDSIENALLNYSDTAHGRNALCVFKKMREGYSQSKCAKYFKWSRAYVSKLFNQYIIPVGKKYLI